MTITWFEIINKYQIPRRALVTLSNIPVLKYSYVLRRHFIVWTFQISKIRRQKEGFRAFGDTCKSFNTSLEGTKAYNFKSNKTSNQLQIMASNQGRSDVENGSSSQRASGSGVSSQNENISRQRPIGLSAWEILGAVSAFKYNVDRMRFYKSSISTIKFLSILNITYTVVGVVFLFLSMFPTSDMNFTVHQKEHFFRLGKSSGI